MASIAKGSAVQPNIVFILVDNVGWGNFGVYGGTVPTPRIVAENPFSGNYGTPLVR